MRRCENARAYRLVPVPYRLCTGPKWPFCRDNLLNRYSGTVSG